MYEAMRKKRKADMEQAEARVVPSRDGVYEPFQGKPIGIPDEVREQAIALTLAKFPKADPDLGDDDVNRRPSDVAVRGFLNETLTALMFEHYGIRYTSTNERSENSGGIDGFAGEGEHLFLESAKSHKLGELSETAGRYLGDMGKLVKGKKSPDDTDPKRTADWLTKLGPRDKQKHVRAMAELQGLDLDGTGLSQDYHSQDYLDQIDDPKVDEEAREQAIDDLQHHRDEYREKVQEASSKLIRFGVQADVQPEVDTQIKPRFGELQRTGSVYYTLPYDQAEVDQIVQESFIVTPSREFRGVDKDGDFNPEDEEKPAKKPRVTPKKGGSSRTGKKKGEPDLSSSFG